MACKLKQSDLDAVVLDAVRKHHPNAGKNSRFWDDWRETKRSRIKYCDEIKRGMKGRGCGVGTMRCNDLQGCVSVEDMIKLVSSNCDCD